MAKIKYIEHDGTAHEVDAEDGLSLMEVAVQNGIPGIDGDCGGSCACATCHVYIEESWVDKLTEQESVEKEMLELAEGAQANSRLACQITVSADLNGLSLTMPESQY